MTIRDPFGSAPGDTTNLDTRAVVVAPLRGEYLPSAKERIRPPRHPQCRTVMPAPAPEGQTVVRVSFTSIEIEVDGLRLKGIKSLSYGPQRRRSK